MHRNNPVQRHVKRVKMKIKITPRKKTMIQQKDKNHESDSTDVQIKATSVREARVLQCLKE